MERVGSVSGGTSALSTAGSIVGRLLTAFVLIPSFALRPLLLGLAGALVLCAYLLVRDRRSVAVAGASSLACALCAFIGGSPASVGGEVVLLRRDTAYHHIAVTQLDTTRWLRFDNLTQSGVNLARPGKPVGGEIESFFLSHAIRPLPCHPAGHPPGLHDRAGRRCVPPPPVPPGPELDHRDGGDRPGRAGDREGILPLRGVGPRPDRDCRRKGVPRGAGSGLRPGRAGRLQLDRRSLPPHHEGVLRSGAAATDSRRRFRRRTSSAN
jgi:hypothetical protein